MLYQVIEFFIQSVRARPRPTSPIHSPFAERNGTSYHLIRPCRKTMRYLIIFLWANCTGPLRYYKILTGRNRAFIFDPYRGMSAGVTLTLYSTWTCTICEYSGFRRRSHYACQRLRRLFSFSGCNGSILLVLGSYDSKYPWHALRNASAPRCAFA